MWPLLFLLQWKVKPSKMQPLAGWRTSRTRILTKPIGPCPALLIGWTPLDYLNKIWDWSQQSKLAVLLILSTKPGAKKGRTQHLWTAVFLRFVLYIFYTTSNTYPNAKLLSWVINSVNAASLFLYAPEANLSRLSKKTDIEAKVRVVQGERRISWLLPSCSWSQSLLDRGSTLLWTSESKFS